VSFYRWHLSDPVLFERSLTATIQQIGGAGFGADHQDEWDEFKRTHTAAGDGWHEGDRRGLAGWGLYERSDDWCGTAFVYCARPQPVPLVNVDAAAADLLNPSELEAIVRH
jgi:hypothetical protein